MCRILHNSAGHLAGAGRSLGGVVVGYLGVRVFSPHPVSAMIDTVGGCNVLLGIIAMAQDVESLYAGVKALTCVVRSNRTVQIEMDRKRCYQTLAMFFKKKRNLLNSHILHLTFSLVGTVNSGQDTSAAIPNITAFQDLLCDLEIWHNDAPNNDDLLRSLLEHLLELAIESNERKQNLKIMRDLQLMGKLLHIIMNVQDAQTLDKLFHMMEALLAGQPRHHDLLLFGQYCLAKLPQYQQQSQQQQSEKSLIIPTNPEFIVDCCSKDSNDIQKKKKNIVLRNRCLILLHGLLFTSRNTINYVICDDISRTLGFDWLLQFMQVNVHGTTVVWAMRILVIICANEGFLIRFRDCTHNGGYLRYTELISPKKLIGGIGTAEHLNNHHHHHPIINNNPNHNINNNVNHNITTTVSQHLPTQMAPEVRTDVLNNSGKLIVVVVGRSNS